MEKSNPITAIQKGLIISGFLIVLSTSIYFLGLQTEKWAQWVSYIILMGGVLWACISYGKENDNNVSFGNVFAHGFKVSAIITCMMIISSTLFIFLFPEIKENAIEIARAEMEKNPQITEEQIEMALSMTQKWFMAFMIGGILLAYLIFGCIASLIGGAVTKKNPSNPFEQTNM